MQIDTANLHKLLLENQDLGDWAILHCYRGSIAHGMYIPNTDPNSIDDIDTMAICVPPLDYYYGLKQYGSKGTREIKRGAWDIVIYEARKAIVLLAQGNPNVLSMLWCNEEHYIHLTEAGRWLIDNRAVFIGKHVYRAFSGYAYAQLKKMTKYSKDGYMGQKRKQLVDKYGYDCKNAAHLIRLLKMGIEFLRDGKLYIYRTDDAEMLLDIKTGGWSLERVQAAAGQLFKEHEQAYENSMLPDRPNKEAVNNLCIQVLIAP